VPGKWALAQHWAALPDTDRSIFAPYLEDLSHPCCFACGWFSERWTEGRSPKASWERALLERAHITPAGLGGTDQADNIILLCTPCHHESPDWHDPWEMATWIARRPERASKEIEHVDRWLAAAAEVPQLAAALRDVEARGGTTDVVLAAMREATRKAVAHGGGVGLSQATMEAILRHTARELARAI
jgi:hypothetical protein